MNNGQILFCIIVGIVCTILFITQYSKASTNIEETIKKQSSITCLDLEGNSITYYGSDKSFDYYPSHGYVSIRTQDYKIYYSAHSCIYKEARN